MSEFKELCFIKTMHNAIYCLKARVTGILTKFFRLKIVLLNNSTVKWKSWNLHFYSSNIACRQYWSSEQICLELNLWISGLLNIGSSHLEASCKKVFLLQNLLKNIKNIRDAVFDLKLQTKRSTTFLKKGLWHMCFLKNFAEVLRAPVLRNTDRLPLLKHLRMRISCFLLWKIAAKDLTSVVVLQITE